MLLGLYIIGHNLLNPIFIKHFNLYFDSNEPLWKGLLLTLVFVIMLIAINVVWDFFDYNDFAILNAAKVVLSQKLFEKELKLSPGMTLYRLQKKVLKRRNSKSPFK
jgi:hypothetical protein